LTFLIEREPLYRTAIASVLEPLGLQLVAGGVRDDDGRYFNAAFAVEPDGRVSASAEKTVLVPFAEYFPLASIRWLNRRFGRVAHRPDPDGRRPCGRRHLQRGALPGGRARARAPRRRAHREPRERRLARVGHVLAARPRRHRVPRRRDGTVSRARVDLGDVGGD